MKKKGPATRDYFAEMYVAGMMADRGWNVYFPVRDIGFDFIATIKVGNNTIIRPIQVKGKYPTASVLNKNGYGYMGKLSQLHPEMILVIPYFSLKIETHPACVAYIPHSQIRENRNKSGQMRCLPAKLIDGRPEPRRDFKKFFDQSGLQLAATADFNL